MHRRAITTTTRSRVENRRELMFLSGILMFALAARIATATLSTSGVLSNDRNSWGFGYEMGQIAAAIAMGDGFSWPVWTDHAQQPTAWMPPIYPNLIAVVFRCFGIFSIPAAVCLLLLQTAFSLLTCYFLYVIAKRTFNARAGLLAAFCFAAYPPAIHFAVQKIWSTSLFTCCLLGIVLALMKLRNEMSMTGGARLGLLTGFTALVDPVIIGGGPVAMAWLYANSKSDRVVTCKVVGTTVALFVLSISPWLIRNYIVFGQYVFIKSNFGNELLLGNNAYASGSYKAPESQRALTDGEIEFLKSTDEPSRNRLLLQNAFGFISAHPLRFLNLTMSRFVHYWTFMMRPAGGVTNKLVLLVYFAMLLAGVAGLFLSGLKKPDVQLVGLFVLTLPLPYYITVIGLFRYRFPVEALLVVPAAYAAYRTLVAIGAAKSVKTERKSSDRPAVSASW